MSSMTFSEIKMVETVKVQFVETIKNFKVLRKMKISGMNLSDRKVYENIFEISKDS
jgi:hypothetical protein